MENEKRLTSDDYRTKIASLETQVARLRSAIDRARTYNLNGINAIFSGFVAYSEIEFKKAYAVLDTAIKDNPPRT